ncbi:hypothetical protein L218DRAFT_964059 [Marasmius fiardii PR-910]|nr:hypothetical protein L218DRAFT_964059 [Marasmius fiardii PR-910]
MNFFVGDEGSRIAESRTRRPQKERLRSNVHDPRLQRSASFYFPEPSPLPRRRIVRPSTSPGIAAAASPKPKTPFITIKWLTKRRDRKDSLKQGEETGNLPHHHHSESHGVTTFKFAPPPVTPPSSDFEDFESRLRSSRRASIIQDTSEMNTHTRVSLIIDHVDVSDSDLEEEDPLSPTTPPPPRITRKDKLQKLLPNEPSHQPHLHRKFPSKLNNSPTSATRPRLNLNLNFARPRPNPYHSTSHSPVTPTYDEQDGWCIDDRYLSTQVADGEEDDDDDDGGGITPVSDIVFGDRPPTPKPPKQQVDRPEKEHEEWKSPMSPSDSIPTPPTSPPPSSSTVTKQVIQGPRRSPSPTGCHSAPFSDLPELPSTTRSEKTVKGDERDDSKTTPRSRGRRLSTGSSYGVIFSRATSPTPGLWSVVDSREVASEVELGPWVGYWNRGSLKEVLAELRELRLNI